MGNSDDHVIDYAKGQMTVVTNSLGHKTAYKLNPIGQVVEVIDARGGTTKYEYDERSLKKTKETTPLGAEILFEYDERGNVVRTKGASGEEAEFTYNSLNLPLVVKKAAGAWEFAYDGRGGLLESRNPCGEVARYTWHDGQLRSVTKPSGGSTELEYDQWKNLARLRFSDGGQAEYQHDRLGRMIRSTAETGITSDIDYDALSRVRRLTQNGGYIVDLQHDAEGRPVVSDKNGEVVRYKYTGFRLAQRDNADGTSVKLRYDTEERLTALQNENDECWTFDLDERGHPKSETSFAGRTVRYERGAAAEVKAVTTASGAKTKFEYDKAGRMLAALHGDGTSETFEYGPGPAPVAAVAEGLRVEWNRDALGRVLEEIQGTHSIAETFNRGHAEARTSSLGLNEQFRWDGRDRLTRLTLNAGNPEAAFEFGYWQGGGLRDIASPNHVLVSSTPDGLGHATSTSINAPGRVRDQRFESRNPDHLWRIFDSERGLLALEHDQRNRLISVGGVDQTHGVRLDGVGNRFPDQSDFRYEAGGQLVRADGTALSYDQDGNLIEKRAADGRTWIYHWNARGLLREVVAPGGLCTRFSYDVLSRRTRKQVVRIQVGGEEHVERDTSYVWSGSQLIHEIGADERTVTWHWGPAGLAPVARVEGGRRHTFVHDRLGTPIEAYDEQGKLVWQMQLDANGAATIDGDPELCPWRWPGQYADAETGLYYNRHRYYDPEHARYISPDPIGLFGGNAPYAYVEDPWSELDFFGLAGHHTIPQKLVETMADKGMLDSSKLPSNFASTTREGMADLAHTPGAHAHSQSHTALSDFLNSEHGLDLRKGTQHGSDWAEYLEKRTSASEVFADLDKFYREWLPEQVEAGKYPLLKDKIDEIQKAYEHDRPNVEGCKK